MQEPTPKRLRGPLVTAIVALSAAAGLIHVVAMEEHLAEWWGYAVFFAIASLAQLFYALLFLMQPWRAPGPAGPPRDPDGNTRRFVKAGIAGNAFLVLLYVVTRSVAITFIGPEGIEREPITFLGLLSKALEIALIVCLARLLHRTSVEPAARNGLAANADANP